MGITKYMGDMSDNNQYQESSEDSSIASCSSLDMGEEGEEASSSIMNSFSSSSSSSLSLSNSDADGPLYELSDLMAQLPIKRGLSKFYDGKSQSFTSLASVKSMEDLVKKDYSHCKKKLKTCKTEDVGILVNHHKSFISPKASIAKKTHQSTRGSFLAPSSSTLGKRSSTSISNNRPSPIPALKTC